MFSTRELSGGYGGRAIISDVTLTVGEGETVAVLGANTAGKTTLVRAIAGLLPVTRGRIDLSGEDIRRMPAHRRVAAGIALVPEGRHVFPRMSVEENLLMGAYHRRREVAAAELDTPFALFPRLRERRTQHAATLSGGEQQMVAIGRALMAKPRLLLLDEPSHGLSPLLVAEVHAAIARINALGLSVLLIEQAVAGQDRFGGRRVADRLNEHRTHDAFWDEERDWIAKARFFFLATASGDYVDCSVKCGDPGFVRIVGPATIEYPEYDGNYMFRSLGNIARNPNVGLLFAPFDGETRRIRVNGRASIIDDPDAVASHRGAKLVVRIDCEIYANCPRYMPDLAHGVPSPDPPRPDRPPPNPEWKRRAYIRDVLPADDPTAGKD